MLGNTRFISRVEHDISHSFAPMYHSLFNLCTIHTRQFARVLKLMIVDENNWRNDYPDEDEWNGSSDEEPRYRNEYFEYGA